MTTSSMFCLEYLGRRANSAAIHPRLRVILRITSARCVSVQSGNARRRLNSAVLRNFGERRKRTCAADAASGRAIWRGKPSRIFNNTRTTAYSAHSFIAFLRHCPPLPRQYACGHGYIAMDIAHDVRLTTGFFFRMNDTARAVAKKSSDDSHRDISFRDSSLRDMTFRDLSFHKISWAVLIFLTLYVCYFSHLGAFGFIGPDEPRYAWIARDMAESGDWVTPRLYGKPWFEKPILYYWAAAVCFKLFGVNETSARLPSAICALLATLALAWMALRIGGWQMARWVLLLLPSTVGMIGFSHAASTDMPFSAMLSIAMACAAVALDLVPGNFLEKNPPDGLRAEETSEDQSASRHRKKTIYLSLPLFGFFLGLAVLAKGPAA